MNSPVFQSKQSYHIQRSRRNRGPIGWNIRTLDTQQPSPEKIIKRIKKRLVPGSILLLHDRMPDSDKLLVQILDFIEKEGYTVVPLDKLMQQIT